MKRKKKPTTVNLELRLKKLLLKAAYANGTNVSVEVNRSVEDRFRREEVARN